MSTESPISSSGPVRLRPLRPDHTRLDATAALPEQLPRPLTSLIGRETEVATARALLVEGGVRLLTLTGPGGVGKTRLALRVAEEAAGAFADGVVFVPLAPISDPELVLLTIARRLGLRETGAQHPADLVSGYLRRRRVLLVLDNFEHVRPAAMQLAALLAVCPGVTALVTSRVLLNVAGEQRFPVAPLALPDEVRSQESGVRSPERQVGETVVKDVGSAPAAKLFVARAQAVDLGFALDADNAATIAAICRRLDGLPLAIELAAASVWLLSAEELLTRLDPALSLLAGGPDDAPERLRTMRQAIAWSYDLLSPQEQALFRRLSIFVGGFTVAGAEWIAGVSQESGVGATLASPALPQPATLDLITSLVEKSLLQRRRTSGETRFEMLETIREFGLERLAESGEAEAIAARHAQWCISLAEGVRRSGSLSQGRGLAALETEHPNMRAALTWLLEHGKTTDALNLAGELAEFWLRHGHWSEGQAWLRRALAADDGIPSAARVDALVGLSMVLWVRDEFARAAPLLDEAEIVARGVGDAGAIAYARLHQGYVAAFQGNLDLALARGEEALATCEAIPQEFSCNGALWLLARVTLAQGDDERARELYGRLLTSARAGGDEISLANGLYGLAILAFRRSEPVQALTGFAEAAAVCRGFGQQEVVSHCLDAAAATAVMLGRMEPGARLFAAAESVRAAVGAVPGRAFQVDRDRHLAALDVARAALGAERFATAWAAGAALSLDEAIAEVTTLAREASRPEAEHAPAATGLTARERDVLRLLVLGWSDKEIAGALHIGRRTVSNHVSVILDKLGVPSRTAAATIAVRDQLI